MKTTFKSLVAALMCLAISCSKEPMQSPLAASTRTIDNTTAPAKTHFIGERFGGGIVFYLADAIGKHGLIADMVDLPQAKWGNGPYVATGTETGIGKGKENTLKILRAQGQPINTDSIYAAWECQRSVRSGYTDWYLPSNAELNQLWIHREIVGGFDFIYNYWSSSEDPNLPEYAYVNGGGLGYSKNALLHVRAIRSY